MVTLYVVLPFALVIGALGVLAVYLKPTEKDESNGKKHS
jgi:uncharacterized membrane protein (DUF373 family)